MNYVTLDEIKHHLRYDDDSNDMMLEAYAVAAEEMINNYITDPIDNDNEPVLKVATLLLIGYLDDNRNAERGAEYGNYLPAPVRQLLSPYRTPTT